MSLQLKEAEYEPSIKRPCLLRQASTPPTPLTEVMGTEAESDGGDALLGGVVVGHLLTSGTQQPVARRKGKGSQSLNDFKSPS